MIEKMKFLSITGPKEDIDRVVNLYLSKYEIQIENALSELKTVKDLRPYIEINPYKELFTRAARLANSRAMVRLGSRIAINRAIIDTTTSSSMRVKPHRFLRLMMTPPVLSHMLFAPSACPVHHEVAA